MYIVYMWNPRLFLGNYRWPAVCACMCTSCGSSSCSQREQWMWGVLLLWILNRVGGRPLTLKTWAATATHLVNVANSKQYAATVRAHTNWTCSEAVTRSQHYRVTTLNRVNITRDIWSGIWTVTSNCWYTCIIFFHIFFGYLCECCMSMCVCACACTLMWFVCLIGESDNKHISFCQVNLLIKF
jgi:hypothetical protein